MALKKTLCLNMIVKNESPVIERCLKSVKGLIDYWVIVDTGSTDGTQEIIRKTMEGVPGELHERPWVDFGHNRQEALCFAKGKADYLLFIDADERMEFDPDFKMPDLNLDYYLVRCIDAPAHKIFIKALVIDNKKNWSWRGVLHEELVCESAHTYANLEGIRCVWDTDSSHRSQDPQKYFKDAKILEDALKTDPNNSRYLFYLGQSYLNAEVYDKAVEVFQRRGELDGCRIEKLWALLMIGRIKDRQGRPAEEIIGAYTKTYHVFPNRAEPLFHMGDYFIKQKNYFMAYLVAKLAKKIPFPQDTGYIEDRIYEYGNELLFANAAFGLGYFEQAQLTYMKILSKKDLPEEYRTFIHDQLSACVGKVNKWYIPIANVT